MITTFVPSFTKVPNINDSVNFETDVNTFLNEINARYVAGNLQVGEINSTATDINNKATAVLNQAVTGGYSQAYINRALISAYTELTALGGETSIVTPNNSNVNVYKNGALLALTTDYTLNGDGVTIDFVVPLTAGQLVQVFDLSKLNNAFYNKSEVDAKTNINGLTAITSIASTDEFVVADASDSYNLKKVTKATLADQLVGGVTTGGLTDSNGTISFYPFGLTTATTDLTTSDYVVVSDSTAPKKITIANFANELPLLGVGQTSQNLTASRSAGVLYTNTSGKPIEVKIILFGTSSGIVDFQRGGQAIENSRRDNNLATDAFTVGGIIPNGITYQLILPAGITLNRWTELR